MTKDCSFPLSPLIIYNSVWVCLYDSFLLSFSHSNLLNRQTKRMETNAMSREGEGKGERERERKSNLINDPTPFSFFFLSFSRLFPVSLSLSLFSPQDDDDDAGSWMRDACCFGWSSLSSFFSCCPFKRVNDSEKIHFEGRIPWKRMEGLFLFFLSPLAVQTVSQSPS